MITRAELKDRAKKTIEGNVFRLLLAFIIVGVITSIVNRMIMGNDFYKGLLVADNYAEYIKNYHLPPFRSFLNTVFNIIFALFDIGLAKLFLGKINNNKINYSDLVVSFTKINLFGRHILMVILRIIFIFLFMLLLIIPGIIKAFGYTMTNYIAAEKPELKSKQILDLSEDMMKGHKLDYFILVLSFIGWWILCGITFGLALIYVLPYFMATTSHFYNSLKMEYALTHPDVFPEMIKKEENKDNNQNPPPVFEELK